MAASLDAFPASEGRSLDVSAASALHDVKVRMSRFFTLDGHHAEGVSAIADGSIIKRFDRTPFPRAGNDVVCPHFTELKWANGCRFDCAWCYLNGTFRFRPMRKRPHHKDEVKTLSHLATFLRKVEVPTLLNSGELADSLVFEGTSHAITKDILHQFKGQARHKLLIVTKSADVAGLIDAEAQRVVIPSFSVNAYPVSERWERGAPHPRARLDGAKALADAGYQVRLRIDPIVPVEGCAKMYQALVDEVFSRFTPERITLGSLRGLVSTISNCQDRSWTKYLGEPSNWGRKVPFAQRKGSYEAVVGHLKDECGYERIAICKDTLDMWRALGMEPSTITCNCVL